MKRHLVMSESGGEAVFLKIVSYGNRGIRYGLTRVASEATAFRGHVEACRMAGRAGTVICRFFRAVEAEQ